MFVGAAGSGKSTAGDILAHRFAAPCVAMAEPIKQLVGGIFDIRPAVLWGASELRDEVDRRYADPYSRHWGIAEQAVRGDAGALFVETHAPPGLDLDHAHRELDAWFDALRNRSIDEGGLCARVALQTLGTEFGRRVLGDHVWVDFGLDEAERLRVAHAAPFAAITDGRFPNEPVRARERGARAVFLEDPEHRAGTKHGGHASERLVAEVDPSTVDAWIVNDKRLGLAAFERRLVDLAHEFFPHLQERTA